jgi:hypothetical protein
MRLTRALIALGLSHDAVPRLAVGQVAKGLVPLMHAEVLDLMSRKSSAFAALRISPLSRLETTQCAPNRFNSSVLEAFDVNAVTSPPKALANCRARWPRPPMPTMPTRSVGFTPKTAKGAKTAIPPHRRYRCHAQLGMTAIAAVRPR